MCAVEGDIRRTAGYGNAAVRLAEKGESGHIVTILRDTRGGFSYGSPPLTDSSPRGAEPRGPKPKEPPRPGNMS